MTNSADHHHRDRAVTERIERLRKRLIDFERASPRDAVVVAVIRGILDLLADEL